MHIEIIPILFESDEAKTHNVEFSGPALFAGSAEMTCCTNKLF